MSDNLSVTELQKNRGNNYGGIFKEELNILVGLIASAIIYLITYFNKSIISESDGEIFKPVFFGLWLAGSYIGNNIIKLIQRFQNRKLYEEQEILESDDGENGIESGVMETYNYSATRDMQWSNWIIAGAVGGVNVVIYLIFLAFIN